MAQCRATCRRHWPLLVCLLLSSSQLGTARREQPVSVEYSDLLALIDACPDSLRGLFEICLFEASCSFHCGLSLNPNVYQLFPGNGNLMCHCDEQCVRYQDCCPDFPRQCESHYKRGVNLYQKREGDISSSLAGCVSGYSVLCDCSEHVEESSFTSSLPWIRGSNRDRVVTDANTGVQYKNLSVFLCHQAQDSSIESTNLLFWNKMYTGPRPSDNDVIAYLKTGSSSKTFLESLRDHPPPGVTPRYGPPLHQLYCLTEEKDHPYCYRMYVETKTFPVQCKELHAYGLPSVSPSTTQAYSNSSLSFTTCDSLGVPQEELDEDDEVKGVIENTDAHISFVVTKGMDLLPWAGIRCRRERGDKECKVEYICPGDDVYVGQKCANPSQFLVLIHLQGQFEALATAGAVGLLNQVFPSSSYTLMNANVVVLEDGFLVYAQLEPKSTPFMVDRLAVEDIYPTLINSSNLDLQTSAMSTFLCNISANENQTYAESKLRDFHKFAVDNNCLVAWNNKKPCSIDESCALTGNSASPTPVLSVWPIFLLYNQSKFWGLPAVALCLTLAGLVLAFPD